jgi:hypothetical protein
VEYLDRIEAARGQATAAPKPDDDQMELDLAMSVTSM